MGSTRMVLNSTSRPMNNGRNSMALEIITISLRYLGMSTSSPQDLGVIGMPVVIRQGIMNQTKRMMKTVTR